MYKVQNSTQSGHNSDRTCILHIHSDIILSHCTHNILYMFTVHLTVLPSCSHHKFTIQFTIQSTIQFMLNSIASMVLDHLTYNKLTLQVSVPAVNLWKMNLPKSILLTSQQWPKLGHNMSIMISYNHQNINVHSSSVYQQYQNSMEPSSNVQITLQLINYSIPTLFKCKDPRSYQLTK